MAARIAEVVDTYTAEGLSSSLRKVSPPDYIRVVAEWLSRVEDWQEPAELTGDAVIDALVASACAHAAGKRGILAPRWTWGRALPSFWHPGPPGMFAWSFAYTPGAFKVHGIVVEADSLECV